MSVFLFGSLCRGRSFIFRPQPDGSGSFVTASEILFFCHQHVFFRETDVHTSPVSLSTPMSSRHHLHQTPRVIRTRSDYFSSQQLCLVLYIRKRRRKRQGPIQSSKYYSWRRLMMPQWVLKKQKKVHMQKTGDIFEKYFIFGAVHIVYKHIFWVFCSACLEIAHFETFLYSL